jgi:acetyl esterase
MPLHPQAEAVLRDVPRIWDDLDSLTAAKARAWGTDLRAEADDRPPAGVAVEQIEVPGAEGPLRGRVYRPTGATPVGTVLWVRGGGFVMGSLTTEQVPAPLALASGCAVVSVEYRLAPEHPFPAALEDSRAALGWVAEHAPALGGGVGRVAVGGESAGGNLAAVLALTARDRRSPDLALQVLLYPMTARTFDGPSRHDPAVSPIAPPEAIEWLWRQYLGERDGSSPLVSPLRAETLAGLPPALVITAEYDLLRDEGEAYAHRLERAGVPVELRRYDGMHHGFVDWHGEIDAAGECIHHMGAAFRRALSPAEGA